jgi:hypothetical protein
MVVQSSRFEMKTTGFRQEKMLLVLELRLKPDYPFRGHHSIPMAAHPSSAARRNQVGWDPVNHLMHSYHALIPSMSWTNIVAVF